MNPIITDTLKNADNESTAAPYWLIIDPSPVKSALQYSSEENEGHIQVADLEDECVVERILEMIPSCITGPFFSREDADNHLKARRYAFSESTYVYCHSGYYSKKYLNLCKEIGVGT